MRKTFENRALVAALLLATGLAGCASQQPQQPSPEIADLRARLERAERAAADAQATAKAAQAKADECMAAQDQKIDRAFKKSQQK